MKTKNIFKMPAFVLLMSAILFSTACQKENAINENTNPKGFALPVTLNVTRQGNATTRATYDGSTKTLSFSAGDKIFVQGYDTKSDVRYFAGTLTWVSGGSFSGTIYTQHEYSGTALQLIQDNSSNTTALLYPSGYGSYNCLFFTDPNTYYTATGFNADNAFADSKAAAVEQFSYESASYYSDGFALSPHNAIVSFTVTGFTAGEAVTASVTTGKFSSISGSVTADASGTATFAIGLCLSADPANYTMTVNGTNFGLGYRTFEAGHIYNVSRSMTADAATVTTAPTATVGTIKSGSSTALVSAGTATGGTMMYAVTTENTKPTNIGEYSPSVPTAAGLLPRTYYVWYYVQADASHKDSDIIATPVEVIVADPTLAEALVGGATVTVYFKYNSIANSCSFTNHGDGTFTFNSGEGPVGGDKTCAKALIIDGNNIIFKQNWLGVMETRWDELGFQVTFDTANNTYSVWKGTDDYAKNASFTSISVNGTDIKSQLTKI